MRAQALKAGLAAALVTFSIGGALAAPITSLVERESLMVHGIPSTEIPGNTPHYAPMGKHAPVNHTAQRNALHHEVWLDNS